jgi:hypothetical protein
MAAPRLDPSVPWPDQLILHGPLTIGGFLGMLVGLEPAIGLAKSRAYAAPVCSASGALLLVFGPPGSAGPRLITMGSAVVVTVFLAVVGREPSLFGSTMLMDAVAWFVGNVWWSIRAASYRLVFWWLAFVVLRIAGERELNRVLQPTACVRITFVLAVAVLVAGVMLVSIARVRV